MNRQWLLVIGLVAGIAGPGHAAVPLISNKGAGPIRVGMSIDEARPFIDESVTLWDGDGPDSCVRYVVKGYPELRFMVEANRVTRVTASGPGLATAEGIQVGDPVAKVRKTYGARLKSYQESWGGGPVFHLTQTTTRGLVFRTYQGRVAEIRAGEGSIQYYEGCA